MGNTMLVRGYTFCSRLHSFLRAVLRPQEAVGFWIHPTQQQPTKPDFGPSLVGRLAAHRPANQAVAEKNARSTPADFAAPGLTARVPSRIFQILRRTLVGPRGVLIHLGWKFHRQCFMGPFLVELLPPQV